LKRRARWRAQEEAQERDKQLLLKNIGKPNQNLRKKFMFDLAK